MRCQKFGGFVSAIVDAYSTYAVATTRNPVDKCNETSAGRPRNGVYIRFVWNVWNSLIRLISITRTDLERVVIVAVYRPSDTTISGNTMMSSIPI